MHVHAQPRCTSWIIMDSALRMRSGEQDRASFEADRPTRLEDINVRQITHGLIAQPEFELNI
jgi:hypothetical protein